MNDRAAWQVGMIAVWSEGTGRYLIERCKISTRNIVCDLRRLCDWRLYECVEYHLDASFRAGLYTREPTDEEFAFIAMKRLLDA